MLAARAARVQPAVMAQQARQLPQMNVCLATLGFWFAILSFPIEYVVQL